VSHRGTKREVPADVVPVLPLRDTVLYPGVVAPILVGQPRSVKLVHDVMGCNQVAALVTQREPDARPAEPKDLYGIGTVATIQELGRVHDDVLQIAVQGIERVRLVDYTQTEPYLVARIDVFPDVEDQGVELEALAGAARERFGALVSLVPDLPDGLVMAAGRLGPTALAYLVASSLPVGAAVRQEILELHPVTAKLRRLVEICQHEIAVRELMRKITSQTSEELTKAQREHILRMQMESIQRELGESEPEQAEARELREQIAGLALPPEARKEAERELSRLERTPTASPEHGIIRTYLDWVVKLPWGKLTGRAIDLARARAVLDEDHYDLEKVKLRIVEYLAVKGLRERREAERELPLLAAANREALAARAEEPAGPEPDAARDEASAPAPDERPEPEPAPPSAPPSAPPDAAAREPILCFVGPPGVGKTSLGQSIARAMSRRFARVSFGGTHDEAEIRGHRRTYIGAMPGRILQTIARAEAADPVFMLDEVDKLGVGFHGDPGAALLEVLDPAQNHAFVDTYLGVPFDLSRVLFICTANTTESIPPALLDRMEVLTLAGYTEQEKLHIARRYLVPKGLEANGLRADEAGFDDDAILAVARKYTREAGVRNLDRELATILRKVATRVAEGAAAPIRIEAAAVGDYLGPERFFDEVAERIDRPGVATGLSVTPSGGDILFVEASVVPGHEERLLLTGMLGDVMRESAQAALTYLRVHAAQLDIDPRAFQRSVVHVHVPAGAIPKDGPSAGVTILAALASQLTGRLVRNDLAMTGEITLRGKVLPVGGIKEKVLAAHRAGIRTILLPRRNRGAIEDVPDEVRRASELVLVESADEVLAAALEPARPRAARRVG
jgi:ATP-dependent Lon protease